jgi:hypothetical protein
MQKLRNRLTDYKSITIRVIYVQWNTILLLLKMEPRWWLLEKHVLKKIDSAGKEMEHGDQQEKGRE